MTTHILWRAGALLLGAGAAAAALVSWRIPAGDGRLGADVRMVSVPTGELDVTPVGPVLSATNLVPGERARGALAVRNQTGSRLTLRVRLVPATTDLDRLLRLRVSAGDRVVDGTLGQLRATGEPVLELVPGERRRLAVAAWLPAGVGPGYQGRLADVRLELDARALAA